MKNQSNPVQDFINSLGGFVNQNVVQPVEQGINTVGKAMGNAPLINTPLIKSPTTLQAAQAIAPEGSPLVNFLSGQAQNIPGQIKEGLVSTFGAPKPGETTEDYIKSTSIGVVGTLGGEGQIYNAKGEPIIKQPTELGGYERKPGGQLVKKGEANVPQSSATTEPAQTNLPPIQEQPTEWPAKPTAVNIPTKKPFKFPGTFDPIEETQASSATKNSKAYSVTTPDIQDAYRRNNITNPNQVYAVKQSLYDNTINPALQNDPTKLPLGVVGGVDKTGKPNGIIPMITKEMQQMDPTLSDQEAHLAAAPMINKITGLAQSESGGVTPNTIGLKNILDYKTVLNQSNAVQNTFEGVRPTTPQDLATVATRNVLSGLLNEYAPSNISQAVKDYGLLEEGFPSYLKAFTKERPSFAEQNLPKSVLGTDMEPIYKAASFAAKNPVTRGMALAGLGAAGALGLPAIYNELTNKNYSSANQGRQPSDKGVHTDGGIVSESYSNIKPNQKTGLIDLPQTPPQGQNTRHYMSLQEYNSAIRDLGNRYTFGTPQYNNEKSIIDTQYSGDQKQADEVFKGNNVKNFMDNAIQYNNEGKDLYNTLASLPTGFWNGVQKAGSIRAYSDPQYAQELQQIDSFNNEFASAYESVTGKTPTNNQLLSAANSPEQASKKYLSMMQFISGTYGKYLDPYLALTSASGAQTTQGTPQSVSNLPAIQQAPASGFSPNMMQSQGLAPLPPIQ